MIYSDLTIGSEVASMQSLKSNENMSFQGVIPIGDGFKVDEQDLKRFGYSSLKHLSFRH